MIYVDVTDLKNRAVEYANKDFGERPPKTNSHGCPSLDLKERVQGQLGELGYKKIFGYPLLYHGIYDIDVPEEQTQIRTSFHLDGALFVRQSDFDRYQHDTHYVLMTTLSFRPPLIEETRYMVFRGWAKLSDFSNEQKTNFGLERESVWFLRQNQLKSPESKPHTPYTEA